MKIKAREIFLGFLIVCSLAAQAQTVPALPILHPCIATDLSGVYVLVDFHETPEGSDTAWHRQFPFQYMGFYPGHAFSVVALAQEMRDPVLLNRYLAGQYARGKQGFRFTQGGRVQLFSLKKQEEYQCSASSADRGEYKKGDLVFTGFDDKRKTGLYKVYRHWY